MKKLLHIDVETCGGFKGRLIFDLGYIVSDVSGNALYSGAFLIKESLPFVAADSFWGSRKNDMLVGVLHKRRIVSAVEAWQYLQAAMDDCSAFVAFNSAYEASAFKQTAKALHLPELRLPAELDLALAAMDILSMKQYADYARQHNHFTPSGNLSAKCEYLLSWLGLGGDKHCHLALEDTKTQLDLYRVIKAKKKKMPDYGKRIMYPAHPAWRRWLKVA